MRFGSQCIVVAIDAKQVVAHDKDFKPPLKWADDPIQSSLFIPIRTPHSARRTQMGGLHPWRQETHGHRCRGMGKEDGKYGAGEILLTSMDQDGQKNGYDLALTRAVAEAVTIPVIASGGVGNLEHIYEGFTKGKADAALAASIFHFREYTIRQAKEYLKVRGVPVRL